MACGRGRQTADMQPPSPPLCGYAPLHISFGIPHCYCVVLSMGAFVAALGLGGCEQQQGLRVGAAVQGRNKHCSEALCSQG